MNEPPNNADETRNRPKLSPEQIAQLPSAKRKAYLTLYLESQRGRPAIRPAPRAGRAASRVIRPLSQKFGPGSQGLKSQWVNIVDPKYAKLSRPGRMTGSKYGRVLTIEAAGPAAALISADSQKILERLNQYLGQGYVARLRFVQSGLNPQKQNAPKPLAKTRAPQKGLSPSQEDHLQNKLASVSNPTLKNALEGLGRKIYAKHGISHDA